MENRPPALDTRLIDFVELGREVSSGFLTRAIRDWPTAEAVIRALGAGQEGFPVRRVVEVVADLFPKLRAIQAGIDEWPVIYFRLPFLAEEAIANIDRYPDSMPSTWFSIDEHEELAEAIAAMVGDLGATTSVQHSRIVYPVERKDLHTVRALWK